MDAHGLISITCPHPCCLVWKDQLFVPGTSPAFIIILILEYSIVFVLLLLLFKHFFDFHCNFSKSMGRIKSGIYSHFIQKTKCTHCNKI